jgi:hypothetical protein
MRQLLLPMLLLAPLKHAAAQWLLTVRHGSATATGYSRDQVGTEGLSFLPNRPASTGLSLARDLGHNRLGIEFRRTAADLALRGEGTTIVTRGALHAWGLALEGSRRLAGQPGQTTLHAAMGLLVERWDFSVGESDARWRAAGRGALQVEIPISRRLSGVLRGDVVVGPSLFKAAELPEGYVRRMAVRRGVELGMGWGW